MALVLFLTSAHALVRHYPLLARAGILRDDMPTRFIQTLLTIVCCVSPAVAARGDVPSRQVDAAINKAKAFLYAQQKNGHWEKSPAAVAFKNDNQVTGGQWGGLTALSTYALLAAGESPSDERLAPAIAFLKTADVRGVYALALRMQVWLLLPPARDVQALMRKDAAAMLAMTRSDGQARGLHDYTGEGKDYSHSRSQYAALAMWAAEQMDVEVPDRYWELAEAAWLSHQDSSGGWTYKAVGSTEIALTPGMTAAGVATLFLSNDFLHASQALDCRGKTANPAIDRGVAWLEKNFDKIASPKSYPRDFPLITLYAVERVGMAGGLKFFGTHDWYEKGVGYVLQRQKPDGSIVADAAFGPVVDTAFGLLFLGRGRAPVAIGKLDYTSDPQRPAAWNQRPRDVANVVRWVGRQLERDLNWQVLNLNVEAVELMDAPILYVAGSLPLTLSPEHEAKLKAYVEMGGLIVGHADCSNAAFATSFVKLGQRLFSNYEFRNLPADHVLYNNLFKHAAWKSKPAVMGLSNGARELMLLIGTGDPARSWQARAIKGREEPWELAANLLLYTTDQKDLRYKGDTHVVVADTKKTPKHKFAVARLAYAGNWDPEPGGWRRLAAIARNQYELDLDVKPVTPGKGELTAAFKFAHVTGTTRLVLDEAGVDELRRWISGGGLLVMDSAGGSGAFTESAEALAHTLFPDSPLKPLASDHPVYKGLGGEPVSVAYRAYVRKTMPGEFRTGRLAGVEVNGRTAIILSREDLSVGLVGHAVEGILGYTPDTATRLTTNALFLVAPKPATRPASQPATKATTGSTKKPTTGSTKKPAPKSK